MSRISLLFLLPAILAAQSTPSIYAPTGGINFGSALSVSPGKSNAGVPATCAVGELVFNTTANKFIYCRATNTFTELAPVGLANTWTALQTFAQANNSSLAVFSDTTNPTDNLLIYNSTGRYMTLQSDGKMSIATLNAAELRFQAGTTPGAVNFFIDEAAAAQTAILLGRSGTTPTVNPRLGLSPIAGQVGFAVRAATSQTADLSRWTDQAEVVQSRIDSAGRFNTITHSVWTQITAPTSPSAGLLNVYGKTGAGLCAKDSAGVETCTGGGGSGLGDPGANGMVARTALNTTAARTFTGEANGITITNPDGVAGAPGFALSSTLNLTSKILRPPNSTTLPGTCTVGDVYIDTDATSGQRWYVCESTNTWVVQGGSGSGATWFSQLNDCLVTRTSSTVLTVASGASATTPCIIGNIPVRFTTAATLTISAGTGTCRLEMDMSGSSPNLKAICESGITAVCSGMSCPGTPTVGTAFDVEAIQLATWTCTSGTWDASGGIELRSALNFALHPVAGTGLGSSDANGKRTLSVDSAVIPTKIKITTAAIDLGSIADGACLTSSTLTVTGAATGDVALVAPPATGTLLSQEGLIFKGLITAANTGVVRVCNQSGGAYDPPSALYTFMVLQ
jgi:hypothetical protein